MTIFIINYYQVIFVYSVVLKDYISNWLTWFYDVGVKRGVGAAIRRRWSKVCKLISGRTLSISLYQSGW